jgi:quinol monooxygenase YgiN
MREEPATLVVELRTRADTVENVLEAIGNVIPLVMREPNFGSIDLLKDPGDPTRILLIEEWLSRSYVLSEVHQKSPHLSNYFAMLTPLLAAPPRWRLWRHETAYRNNVAVE